MDVDVWMCLSHTRLKHTPSLVGVVNNNFGVILSEITPPPINNIKLTIMAIKIETPVVMA